MVELDLYDLMVLYAIVNFPSMWAEVLREDYPYMTDDQIKRMAGRKPGIAALWGNKDLLPEQWENQPVPGGIVNRMILRYRVGAPLLHAKQFYRIERRLKEAGLLADIDGLHFMYNDKAKRLVNRYLTTRNPNEWPVRLVVQDGQALEMATL